jgi:flagellar hook-basal body complex protein FliE
MEPIPPLPEIGGLEELQKPTRQEGGVDFAQRLEEAVASVDRLQRQSEQAQISFARGEEVELHDVLIKIEEAEIAVKTMMEVRNKLVDAYREIMQMGR